jgi:hypothetical protein
MAEKYPEDVYEPLSPDERNFVRLRATSLLPPPGELQGLPDDLYEASEGTGRAQHKLGDRDVSIWGYVSPSQNSYEEYHIYAAEIIIEENGLMPHKIVSSEYWTIDNSEHGRGDLYIASTHLTDGEGINMLHRFGQGTLDTDAITYRIWQRLATVHNNYTIGSAREHFYDLADILEQLGPHNRVETGK